MSGVGMNQTSSAQRFIDFHLYMTSVLQRQDMRAVGLQLAMDLLHEKVHFYGLF